MTETKLEPGSKVMVRWTSSHNEYAAEATVARINAKSIAVLLDNDVMGWLPRYKASPKEIVVYPAGRRIGVPKASALGTKWSPKNGVFAKGD